jgi:ADP-heptose:LPS heptosyltransferase
MNTDQNRVFEPRNILVIDFGQLGDVVMSLPALRAIRERFPRAKITMAVGKPAGELIHLSGYVDEILEVDRVSLRDGPTLISIAKIIKLVSNVRKLKFDFVIDLHSYYETNILGFLSGAPHRLYSRRENRSLDFLANFKPRPVREVQSTHLIDRYLDLLKPLGIEGASRLPTLRTSSEADVAVEELLKKEKAESGALLVGVFPGAGHTCRRWPAEKFGELADYLVRNEAVRIIVFAGPEERKIVGELRPLFPSNTIFFDRLTIPQLASAQARLTLFVSNDTGPVHIAAAVGTPVIVILDRPNPHGFVPIGDANKVICSPVITEIPVETVYKAAHEQLAASRTEKLFR